VTDLERAINDAVDDTVDDIGDPIPLHLQRPRIVSPKVQSVAEQLLNVAESIKEIHKQIDDMQGDFKRRLMDLNEEVEKRLLAIRKSMGSRA